MKFPPRRPASIGPILFVTGVVLLSVDFFLSAAAYYEIYNSSSVYSFQSIELAYGLGEVFTAIGVLLAATGWVVGKRSAARIRESPIPRQASPLLGIGQAIVLLGAGMIAVVSVYLGTLELTVYVNIYLTEPWWIFPLLYSIDGAGIVALACGWLIHYSGSSLGLLGEGSPSVSRVEEKSTVDHPR